MDSDELQLLNETLLGLAVSERNGLITKALDAFGWRDMLTTHPEEAISALFDAQGRTGTWSAALHDVLAIDAHTLGMTGPVSVVLPRPGSSPARRPARRKSNGRRNPARPAHGVRHACDRLGHRRWRRAPAGRRTR